MTPLGISAVAFVCMVAGVSVGILLNRSLPPHHFDANTKDVVRLAMAMIATLTALVLGLVTASAKNAFDTEDSAIRHTAASLLTLDRMLADYGDETKSIRDALRDIVADKAEQIWPAGGAAASGRLQPSIASERIVERILALDPGTTAQRWYQTTALALCSDVLEAVGASVPMLFLVIVIFWLSVLFGSFSLFAPRNGTVIGSLLICALSAAASIFLILEMNDPFGGVMKVSGAPMHYAVSRIDR